LKENMSENIPSILPYAGSDDSLFSKWKIPFDNPKPYKFSAELIKYFTNPGDIILDFFAGSGTVGHSVFDLNKDGGNRKFILIQLEEAVDDKSIAKKMGFDYVTEITSKRLKFASDSYNISDKGYRKYKLSQSNYNNWFDYDGSSVSELENLFDQFESPLKENFNREDLLFEIILIEGFALNSEINRYHEDLKNELWQIIDRDCPHKLIICLDEEIFYETITNMTFLTNDIFICLDKALSDKDKMRMSDKGLIKTI